MSVPRSGLLTIALLAFGTNAYAEIAPVGTATTAEEAAGGTQTLTEVSGVQAGDLIFVACGIDAADGSWTDPADFAEIDQVQTVSNETLYIGYKVRGETAGNGYQFTWSGSDEQVRCTMVAFRPVDPDTPLDVTYSQMDHMIRYTAAENELDPAQPITTNTDGALVLLVQFWISGSVSAAGAPSGYDLIVDLQATNRTHFMATKTVASAGTETPGSWTHSGTGGNEVPVNFTLALRPQASLALSDADVSPATNGYTISGTLSDDGTVYAVAVLPGSTAPSCAQIQAGDDGDNQDAEIAASEMWTGSMADSFALAKAGAFPRHDVYVCASDGETDTDVETFTDEDRSPDADQTIVALTSVSSTSPFAVKSDSTGDTTEDSAEITGMTSTAFLQPGMRVEVSAGFDCDPCIVESVGATSITLEEVATSSESNVTVSIEAYYNPAVAAGDVVEHDNETSHGDKVTWSADGNFDFKDTSGGVYTTIGYNIQDVSGDGDFMAGPPAWSEGDDVLHLFSTRPSFDPDLGQFPLLLYTTDDTSIPLACADDEDGQDVSVSARGSLPTGLSVSDNALVVSTPSEDESGTTITLDCADSGGLYATPRSLDVYVTDDAVTMPDLSGGDVDAALIAMMTARPWLDTSQLSVTYACEIGAANDDVISQDPAASETIDATETVSVVAARSSICLLLRRRR